MAWKPNLLHSFVILAVVALPVFPIVKLAAQTSAANPSGTDTNSTSAGWVVRDPTTGRMFHQRFVQVAVPSTRWENKTITTTVQQPQWTSQTVPETQVVYQPYTTMTLEPYWIGRWNPFRQPTLAYRYKPVTNWRPVTVTNQRVVMAQTFVPTQQTIQVPQPVTETRTVQQLVQTEIPQAPGTMPTAISYAPRPRLAYSYAHRPLTYQPQMAYQPQWSQPAAPTNTIAANPIAQGLRPVVRAMQGIFPSNYAAPLQTASSGGSSRDAMQTGMRSTVLR